MKEKSEVSFVSKIKKQHVLRILKMYIYAPYLDAYLCFYKTRYRIQFRRMDSMNECEWENWDVEENKDGTRSIVYLFPNGTKKFLAYTRSFDRQSAYVFFGIPEYKRGFCVIYRDDGHLFWTQEIACLVCIPNIKSTSFIAKAEDMLNEEETATAYIEMMSTLPHQLK